MDRDPSIEVLAIEPVVVADAFDVGSHGEQQTFVVAWYRNVVASDRFQRQLPDQGAGLHPHQQGTDLTHRGLDRLALGFATHPSELLREAGSEMLQQPLPRIDRLHRPFGTCVRRRPVGLVEREARIPGDEHLALPHRIGQEPRVVGSGAECRPLRRNGTGDLPSDL